MHLEQAEYCPRFCYELHTACTVIIATKAQRYRNQKANVRESLGKSDEQLVDDGYWSRKFTHLETSQLEIFGDTMAHEIYLLESNSPEKFIFSCDWSYSRADLLAVLNCLCSDPNLRRQALVNIKIFPISHYDLTINKVENTNWAWSTNIQKTVHLIVANVDKSVCWVSSKVFYNNPYAEISEAGWS